MYYHIFLFLLSAILLWNSVCIAIQPLLNNEITFEKSILHPEENDHPSNEFQLINHSLKSKREERLDNLEETTSTFPMDNTEGPPSKKHAFPTHTEHEDHSSIHVASWKWEYVRTPFIYTSVVIVAGLCKVGFHHAGILSSIIPESCLLIVLGIIVGAIVHFTDSKEFLPPFTPKAFFLFLLPPIVLESAYSLHDRAFFRNLEAILVYAIVGTAINCFAIGFPLYGLIYYGLINDLHMHMVECLVFSALISAVDPVSVLAIFQEIGVNKDLYFLVFGESLLNDAVTIVLYTVMVGFSKAKYISGAQIGLGMAAFLCVSIGGLAIGISMGILTALITKHTQNVRVVEPLAMLGVAYLSYLLAEMVHFSGIISIIGCGLIQAHYASKNISKKSNTTVKYFTKMMSSICDTVIFLFLGMVLVNDQHVWDTGFVFWATGLCFVIRFASVFFLTFIVNRLGCNHYINIEEQFIMAYGGLRGAVAFSLVIMLRDIAHRELFITATLFIILFTVFIQGATIKPLVKLLKIRTQSTKKSSIFTEVNIKLLDHVMAGVEEVAGFHGENYWKAILFYYNDKYLTKWLQCRNTEDTLSRVYTRIMLEDHFAHLYGPAAVIEDRKPLLFNKVSPKEADDVIPLVSDVTEDILKSGRQNVTFDIQEPEERSPLRKKKKRKSESDLPQRPTQFKTLFSKRICSEDDPSKLLKKAFLDNPYAQLHHKYDKNLVNDVERDVDTLLKIRRIRGRRLTLMAMSDLTYSTPSSTRRHSTADEHPTTNKTLVTPGTSFLLEKAQRRKMQRKTSDEVTSSSPNNNKSSRLERQTAVKSLSGSYERLTEVDIGEENETNKRIPKDSCTVIELDHLLDK